MRCCNCIYGIFYRENSSLLSKLVLKPRSKLNTSEECSAKAQTACTLTAAAFASDFITFTLLNTRKMKLFGLSSLLGCAFFRIRLGIPCVIACSTFPVTFFCFYEEIFSAEMIPALPPVLCHFHQFCHILCVCVCVWGGGGGGSLLSSSKHISKYSFFSTIFPVASITME